MGVYGKTENEKEYEEKMRWKYNLILINRIPFLRAREHRNIAKIYIIYIEKKKIIITHPRRSKKRFILNREKNISHRRRRRVECEKKL